MIGNRLARVNNCAGAQRRRFLFRIWSFKRSSVRPSEKKCLYGKKRAKHPKYECRDHALIICSIWSVDFQGAEENWRSSKKEWFGGTLKKSSFFDFLIIQIVLNFAVLELAPPVDPRPRATQTKVSTARTHEPRTVMSCPWSFMTQTGITRTANIIVAR